MSKRHEQFVLKMDEVSNKDVPLVGGKNASLGEMLQKLKPKGVSVPGGFIVTAAAYRYFIEVNHLDERIREALKGLDTHNMKDLALRGAKVRHIIRSAKFPEDLELEISKEYKALGRKNVDVAVRSSATAEDLPDASFAGQQDTYLNVHGVEQVIARTHDAFASLFTNRAISYREDKNFDHFDIALSVGIQYMVRSDKASSGVMFTLDTESGFKDTVIINAIYGLGENIVQGTVNPDEFVVFKQTVKKGFNKVLSKTLGTKKYRMIYDSKNAVRNIKVSDKEQKQYAISDEEALKLAKWGIMIEDHYKRPMDIEWAKDGLTGELYIVQARPETVHATSNKHILEEYKLKTKDPKVIVNGVSVGKKIGQGKARVIKDLSDIHKFKSGEVLVTTMTDPDWEPIMKIASAIVTDSGGRTAHAAIVSRELGIPAVVGSENATKVIETGQTITVDCSRGEQGLVYEGLVPYEVKKMNVSKLPKVKCQVMMNIGEPGSAFTRSQIPNDGVGLARLEFIINESIKAHPLALINLKKLKDKKNQREIEKIVTDAGYSNGKDFFIGELAEGIAKLAAAFYPKDVIVRMSDFRSNEYRYLLGGEEFEPEERNPMIGWRGASRYYDEVFRPAFDIECAAFRRVRDELGLTNVKIMLPFVRTLEEAKRVQFVMAKNGLKRGKNKLEVYMMVEIPSNVILAREFSKLFDGFSIGSNDLTQLTLGVDRDSELVSHIYDERNEAVKIMIRNVVKIAKETKTKIGICGQAPSDFPDFAEFLLRENIDSISLTPDTVLSTRLKLAKIK